MLFEYFVLFVAINLVMLFFSQDYKIGLLNVVGILITIFFMPFVLGDSNSIVTILILFLLILMHFVSIERLYHAKKT